MTRRCMTVFFIFMERQILLENKIKNIKIRMYQVFKLPECTSASSVERQARHQNGHGDLVLLIMSLGFQLSRDVRRYHRIL